MSAEQRLTSPQPMPTPGPNRAPRPCPAIRCTDLAGAHAAASNHYAASMRRHIATKESR